MDEQLGDGCLTAILQLLGFRWLWGTANRMDAQSREQSFRANMALLGAERAAQEWNAAEEEGFLDDEREE